MENNVASEIARYSNPLDIVRKNRRILIKSIRLF